MSEEINIARDRFGREIKPRSLCTYVVDRWGSPVFKFGYITPIFTKHTWTRRWDWVDGKRVELNPPVVVEQIRKKFRVEPISWELSDESWWPPHHINPVTKKYEKIEGVEKPLAPRVRYIYSEKRIMLLDMSEQELRDQHGRRIRRIKEFGHDKTWTEDRINALSVSSRTFSR